MDWGVGIGVWGLYGVFRWVSQTMRYFLAVTITRIIAYWGVCWGSPIFGNYHVGGIQGLGSTEFMEKKMETTIVEKMEENMENDMKTGIM